MEDENIDEIDQGEPEVDLYSEKGREELAEDDEIDEIEEGFMQGYEGGDRLAKCAICKKILADDFVEEEFEEEIYRFCTDEHAEAYKRKKQS
tara:strand:+ start:59958 stop:60233 length:276 start_codon:yes stop_codon:yes gene_type:complete